MAGTSLRKYVVLAKEREAAAAGWYAVSAKKIGPFSLYRRIDMEALPCYAAGRIEPEEIVHEVLALAARERAVELAFGNSTPDYLPALGQHAVVQEKITFVLDLGLDRDTLLAGMKDNVRRKIRKAGAGGIRVECVSAGAGDGLLDALPRLFEHTIARHIGLGKQRKREESPFVRDTVRQLVAAGKAMVLLAFARDEPLSCAVLSTYNRRSDYLFGASSRRGYELNASSLILWTAVERLQRLGYRSFGLGEVPARACNPGDTDHGLYRFKKDFGGTASTAVSGSIVLSPLRHRALSALKRIRRGFGPR